MTGSRKSLIAVLLVLLLWTLLCYMQIKKSKHVIWNIFAISLIVYIVLLFLKPYYSDSILSSRMSFIGNEFEGGGYGRWGLYNYGYELMKTSPMFGYGYGGFKVLYGRFYSHATLVEIPVSGGIIGSILYFSAYILLYMKLFKHSFRNKRVYGNIVQKEEARLLFILLIMLMFYSTVIIHPYDLNSMAMIGLLIGGTNTLYYPAKLNIIRCHIGEV